MRLLSSSLVTLVLSATAATGFAQSAGPLKGCTASTPSPVNGCSGIMSGSGTASDPTVVPNSSGATVGQSNQSIGASGLPGPASANPRIESGGASEAGAQTLTAPTGSSLPAPANANPVSRSTGTHVTQGSSAPVTSGVR